MKELDGYTIPNIPPTDGTCAGSPASVANAAANGWWSCGGYTRPTDITACPDKMTWGVSFDDGPAPYSTLIQRSIYALMLTISPQPSSFMFYACFYCY